MDDEIYDTEMSLNLEATFAISNQKLATNIKRLTVGLQPTIIQAKIDESIRECEAANFRGSCIFQGDDKTSRIFAYGQQICTFKNSTPS